MQRRFLSDTCVTRCNTVKQFSAKQLMILYCLKLLQMFIFKNSPLIIIPYLFMISNATRIVYCGNLLTHYVRKDIHVRRDITIHVPLRSTVQLAQSTAPRCTSNIHLPFYGTPRTKIYGTRQTMH